MRRALIPRDVGRALLAVLAAVVMLGLALPGTAQAAAPATSPNRQLAVAPAASDYPFECSHYSFDHNSMYHYYQYCYDWKYKSESDWRSGREWYASYWLFYWYYDGRHNLRHGSCHWDHDFGYSHPGVWKQYCPGH